MAVVETKAIVGEDGSIVLPAAIRKELGIKPGTRFFLRVEDGELRIVTFMQRVAEVQAAVAKYFPPGTLGSEELIAERREEARREFPDEDES